MNLVMNPSLFINNFLIIRVQHLYHDMY